MAHDTYNEHDINTWPDVKIKVELMRAQEDVRRYEKALTARKQQSKRIRKILAKKD